MKTRIMFNGYIIDGYFITRVADDRFLFYVPGKYRILHSLVNQPFLNLNEYHLALPNYARGGKPSNPDYRKQIEKYPITEPTI